MGKEVKRSFIFNIDWREVLMDYPAEVRYEVYDAIIEYAASGKLSELKPLAKMAFSFIKKEMDYNNNKYNEIISKRSEAGKKGMLSRYGNKAVTSDNKSNKAYQTVTNVTDNVYDNVNDNKNIPPIIPPAGEKEGEGEEKNKRKRARPPIDTGFIDAPFRGVMDKWLEYKRARGQTYKSEASIKTCYKKLLEMSGDDPVKAEAIVENSIANNYAGLFPIKNTYPHETDKPAASASLTEEERERSFLEHINRKLGNIP